jgi:alpha/beta superfamily hydrolase
VEAIRFGTEDGVSLEGELRRPQGKIVGSTVICHAHPRHGGSKDHPILWAVRNALARRGFVVLAFNFRGTMGSGGTYAGGRAEIRDVHAAIGRVRQEADGPTLVCGWSFGAAVALREALGDERVSALALIAPPLDPADIDVPPIPPAAELRTFRKPMLFLAGEGDVYCPRPRLESLAHALPNAGVEILAGTDHFLWRREDEAAEAVAAFADRVFGFEG